MRKTITDYELMDHGIDHAQYFQGCGVSCTKYDMCFTGCGSNFSEALDDCLEQIASSGAYELGDIEERIKADMFDDSFADKDKVWPTSPNTDEYYEENEDSEMYYYVSLRLR